MLVILAVPASAAPDPAEAKTAPAAAPRGMMRYDTNKDGFVDRGEWAAGQEARFKQLDTDKDGKLSEDELFARTRPAGNDVLPSDAQARRQSAYFRLLDTDKDGFVSKAEFMAGADRNFARCDLDRDGRINTAECRQALRRPATEPASAKR
jgi:Ca2+-binding EF-hand superfamily protein